MKVSIESTKDLIHGHTLSIQFYRAGILIATSDVNLCIPPSLKAHYVEPWQKGCITAYGNGFYMSYNTLNDRVDFNISFKDFNFN